MRTALMGAGSLGIILGAYITKAGKQIDLIAAHDDRVQALNEKGARVVGTVDFTVPVKAVTPREMEGMYDLVLLLVKQTYNEEAFEALKPHVHEKSIIVTMQNGLPEPALVDVFGVERVMGCPVGWGATFKEPGVSELTSEPSNLTFDLGRVDGKITPDVRAVQDVLSCMCKTNILENLMGVRWTKLMTNASLSGMSAVLGCTFGEILDDRKAYLCIQYITNEVIQVARASGVKMEPMHGHNFGEILYFETVQQRDDAEVNAFRRKAIEPHRALKASMLQDLLRGRKTEIGAINGAVCVEGDRVGVDTPFNDAVVHVIRGIENGKYKPSFDNLARFTIPE